MMELKSELHLHANWNGNALTLMLGYVSFFFNARRIVSQCNQYFLKQKKKEKS